ncbi:serine hydrolase [Streptomyces plumbiresistens]|uniref:Serine hydrolase n=1 Tax=Streptomyces plumbiresistens TaxID=511811 RepID=A0ABP7SLQ9_9ACTN
MSRVCLGEAASINVTGPGTAAPKPRERDFGGGPRPTLADWLTAPGNKWAFRHARELFTSERVGGAPGPAWTPPLHQSPLTEPLTDYLGRSHTDALVVLHDGRPAVEWYAPGVQPDDRHILFSVTKSVVGIVASALVADGLLDPGAPVSSYVPETAVGGYGDATVRELLDMTANIRFVEDYDGPDVRRYRVAVGQLPSANSEGIHAFVCGLPSVGRHGESLSYVSPTADLAAWVCERAAGMSLAQLVSTYVWGPMGAESDGDMLLDHHGAARASGGLCATARDMARIGHLLIGDGPDGAGRSTADLLRPGDRGAWATGTLADFMPGAAYRSFWYQPNGTPDVLLAAGIHGQRIYVDVSRRVVVAQQASLPEAYDHRTWTETLPAFESLARALAGDD